MFKLGCIKLSIGTANIFNLTQTAKSICSYFTDIVLTLRFFSLLISGNIGISNLTKNKEKKVIAFHPYAITVSKPAICVLFCIKNKNLQIKTSAIQKISVTLSTVITDKYRMQVLAFPDSERSCL